MSKKALVRRPSRNLDEGIVTNIERQPVDVDLAFKQWDDYVEAMKLAGWDTVTVPPASGCPDSAFVEDTMVVYKNVAVLANPGAAPRRPEIPDAEAAVEQLGYSINRIREPGTLDGGDVLKVGDTVYVGRGGRTNPAAVAQLRSILEPLGATVVAVPVHEVLHLKSAVTALPDGTIIGFPPVVDDPAIYPRFMPVPEEAGAHVVDLGSGRLLMAAGCPRSADLMSDLGYQPVTVDISEFEKLEGCVTCLSVRLRGLAEGAPAF